MCIVICTLLLSRPARGAWVEIIIYHLHPKGHGRAPQGARGLKFLIQLVLLLSLSSRPARGAWVEINKHAENNSTKASRPARGAWVEIGLMLTSFRLDCVAPRKGRVG